MGKQKYKCEEYKCQFALAPYSNKISEETTQLICVVLFKK